MKKFSLLIWLIGLAHCLNGQSLILSDTQHDQLYFGWDVDLDQNRMLVGAYGAEESGYLLFGNIYFYTFQEGVWNLEEKMESPLPEPTKYGFSVALSGDYGISSKGSNISGQSRSAFILHNTGADWFTPQQLQSGDAYFGIDVDMHGEYAIVGAMLGNKDNYRPGSAHIYKNNGEDWAKEAVVNPSDQISGQTYFGEAVAINEHFAVVGAYGADDYTGAAYVYIFQDSSWVELQKLTASDGGNYFSFGDDVAIYDSTIIIGASRDGEGGSNAGAAYVFEWEDGLFIQKTKLLPNEVSPYDRFGRAVAVFQNKVLIGASRDDSNEENGGAAYLFEKTGNDWILIEKIAPNLFTKEARFGSAVSLSEFHMAIGGYNYSENGICSGAVYVQEID